MPFLPIFGGGVPTPPSGGGAGGGIIIRGPGATSLPQSVLEAIACCCFGNDGGSGSGIGSGGGPPVPGVGTCCDWCAGNCPATLQATATACGLSCTKTLEGGCPGVCPDGAFSYEDDVALRTTVNGNCDPCPTVGGPIWLAAVECEIRLTCANGRAVTGGQMASAGRLVRWLDVPVTIVSCDPFYAVAQVVIACGLSTGGADLAVSPCAACEGQVLLIEFTE